MAYELRIAKKWQKFIEALDSQIQSQIIAELESISEDPFLNEGKVQKYKPAKVYKRRVGEYRILYSIAKKIKIVEIVKIGHRKNVYD